MSRRFAELPHLAARFLRSLRPRPLSAADAAWVAAVLAPAEFALWQSQQRVDQVHTVAVARRVETADPWVVKAALLHDVGKAEAHLGVVGRVAATVLELVGVGRFPGRLGRYLAYPELGARSLSGIGADERVVAWAREHHRPAAQQSSVVPLDLANLLAAADR